MNLFNLIDSNYVGIQLDIQGLHGLGTEEQVKRLTDVLNQYFTTVMNTTWEKIIMDTRVQPILMLLRSIYEGCQPWYQYSNTDSEQRFYKANYELVLEKIIKTYSVDYLTLNVIEHSMHINVMTKQEELARNIEVETDDIRVICTTVHKAKGLEYGCVIMPYMGMDIASMKKADLDVYVENEKLAYGIRIGDEPNKKYNSNYDVSQEQNERVNEESRVLYVALTRAIRMDQVRVAKDNIRVASKAEIACYYSDLASEEKRSIIDRIKNRKLRLLFISPEALIRNEVFKQVIETANDAGYLRNLIIDEAHIVIEWGNFFRVDYQCFDIRGCKNS